MAVSVASNHSLKPPLNMDRFPKAFVASLKVLFDILDEDADGLVHIAEIEKRWAADGATSTLPFGVLNGLRNAAPKNGQLSFERFCDGLKMSLNSERGVGRTRDDRHPNTAKVRPNNVVRPMAVRARSAPQLDRAQGSKPRSLSSGTDQVTEWEVAVQKARHSEDKLYSNKHRPREDVKHKRRSAPRDVNANDPFHPGFHHEPKTNVHHRPKRNETDHFRIPHFRNHPAPDPLPNLVPGKTSANVEAKSPVPLYDYPRSPAEAKRVDSNGVTERCSPRHSPRHSPKHSPKQKPDSPKQKTDSKARSKHAEPRRHTVTNGIDYNLLKRMKQLEQERDVLLQGLEVAERARDWYQRQLAYVRQRQPGYSGNSQFTHGEDLPASGHEDRLAYRTARILEINRQLTYLMDNPEQDFPDHMNLAVGRVQPPQVPPKLRASSTSSLGSTNSSLVSQLREQNRLLTKEVSQKSEVVTQLEKDKTALIRQLFEARGKKTGNNKKELPENTTFI